MKLAIGVRVREGPWGGGNRFALALHDHLRSQGVQTTSTLEDPDIDLILLTEARRSSASSSFNDRDISAYLHRR